MLLSEYCGLRGWMVSLYARPSDRRVRREEASLDCWLLLRTRPLQHLFHRWLIEHVDSWRRRYRQRTTEIQMQCAVSMPTPFSPWASLSSTYDCDEHGVASCLPIHTYWSLVVRLSPSMPFPLSCKDHSAVGGSRKPGGGDV